MLRPRGRPLLFPSSLFSRFSATRDSFFFRLLLRPRKRGRQTSTFLLTRISAVLVHLFRAKHSSGPDCLLFLACRKRYRGCGLFFVFIVSLPFFVMRIGWVFLWTFLHRKFTACPRHRGPGGPPPLFFCGSFFCSAGSFGVVFFFSFRGLSTGMMRVFGAFSPFSGRVSSLLTPKSTSSSVLLLDSRKFWCHRLLSPRSLPRKAPLIKVGGRFTSSSVPLIAPSPERTGSSPPLKLPSFPTFS